MLLIYLYYPKVISYHDPGPRCILISLGLDLVKRVPQLRSPARQATYLRSQKAPSGGGGDHLQLRQALAPEERRQPLGSDWEQAPNAYGQVT